MERLCITGIIEGTYRTPERHVMQFRLLDLETDELRGILRLSQAVIEPPATNLESVAYNAHYSSNTA